MQRALSLAALALVACSDVQSAELGSDVPVTDAGSTDAGSARDPCDLLMNGGQLVQQFANGVPAYCTATPYFPGCPLRDVIEALSACLTQLAATVPPPRQ